MLNSDYILQQIADSSKSIDDNLSSMRELLTDIAKNNKKESGSSGKSNNSNNSGNRTQRKQNSSGSFSGAFKSLFGEAQHFGAAITGNNGKVQTAMSSLGVSAKVLESTFGKLPGPVGWVSTAFLKVAEAGVKLYEYMNEQLEMYNDLNSSGVTLAKGMTTARDGAASAFMSLNSFNKVLAKNSDSLAAMDGQYGDGVEHFGNLLQTIQLTQNKMGLYGVSQEKLADLAAKNYKFERMYAGNAQMRNLSEQASTQQFVESMTFLSRSVGKSVDELLSKFSSFGDNLDTGVGQSALQTFYGLTEERSAEVMKGMNSVFSAYGDFGSVLQKLNTSKLQLGSLPEEYNNQITQLITDRLAELEKAGVTDPKAIQKAMNDFIGQNVDEIKKQMQASYNTGNTAAGDLLQKLLQMQKTFNANAGKPLPATEQLATLFNNWIGKNITEPLQKTWNQAKESSAQWVLDIAKNSDGVFDFLGKLTMQSLAAIPKVFSSGFNYLGTLIDNLGVQLFGNGYKDASKGFSNFIDYLSELPLKLWNSVLGWFNTSTDDKEKQVQGIISTLYDSVKNAFNYIGNLFSSFSLDDMKKNLMQGFDKLSHMDFNYDDVSKSIMNSFEAMKSSLSSWWETAKSWFSNDESTKPQAPKPATPPPAPLASTNPIAGKQQVTAAPEITKPQKVEQANQQTPEAAQDTQTADNNEDMKKLLSSILNNLEAQSSNSNQLAILLRTIADNTEPPRNV